MAKQISNQNQQQEKTRDWPRISRDLAVTAGFLLIVVGIGSCDWRVACVTAGTILLTGGIFGMYNAARSAKRRRDK